VLADDKARESTIHQIPGKIVCAGTLAAGNIDL
jgi:hypothetical protein